MDGSLQSHACGLAFSAKVANARDGNNEALSGPGEKACLQKRYNYIETSVPVPFIEMQTA